MVKTRDEICLDPQKIYIYKMKTIYGPTFMPTPGTFEKF